MEIVDGLLPRELLFGHIASAESRLCVLSLKWLLDVFPLNDTGRVLSAQVAARAVSLQLA